MEINLKNPMEMNSENSNGGKQEENGRIAQEFVSNGLPG